MDSSLGDGLFAIALSDSEDDTTTTTKKEPLTQEQRTAQTEEDHQKLRQSYRPKIQDGEIWKTISLPLDPNPIKTTGPEILYAVEELYFYRRYVEAVEFIRHVLGGEHGASGLEAETQRMLRVYELRCAEKAKGILEKERKFGIISSSN